MKSKSGVVLLCLVTNFTGVGMTATEIVQKAQEKYKALSSYVATGKTVSVIDASDVDTTALPNVPPGIKDSKEFKQAIGKPQTLTHTFTIKLSRPDLYRIEWEQKVHPTFSNKGAVWSAGEGHSVIMNEKEYSKPSGRDLALATATGISGGAAHTVPSIFFDNEFNSLKQLTKLSQQEDEKIEGDNCYVVGGDMAGQRMVFWISQETFLVRQRQHVLGSPLRQPELSDEAISQSLEQLNQPVTPVAIAEMRNMLQLTKKMTSQMKGTMTETHVNIQINQPLDREEFKYAVPPSLKPAPAPF